MTLILSYRPLGMIILKSNVFILIRYMLIDLNA